MADFGVVLSNKKVYSASNCSTAPGVSFAFTNSQTSIGGVSYALKSVKYHKKMYEHCTLEVEMFVSAINTSVSAIVAAARSTFYRKTIAIYEDMKEADDIKFDFQPVASEYVINRVTAHKELSNTDGVFITIKAVSPDIALDRNPYCRIYDHQKLKSEIIDPTIHLLWSQDQSITDKGSDVALRKQDTNVNAADVAMPYLVQYNETFFDFLVRVVNRADKYVYYENGTLNLGEDSGTTVLSAHAIVDDPSTDYLESDFNKFNNRVWYCGTDYCRESNKAAVIGVTTFRYNNELFDNSQTYPITSADNYSADGDVFTTGVHAVGSIASAFTADSAIGSITNAAMSVAKTEMLSKLLESDITTDYNTTLAAQNKIVADDGCIDRWINDVARCQYYYRDYDLDISFLINCNALMLGNRVSYDNNDYIVTEITGSWGTINYKDNKGDSQSVIGSQHHVKAHIAKDAMYLGEKRIRRSSAQKAVVTQTNDPLRMGRVRVTFPWDYDFCGRTPWLRVCLPSAEKGGGFCMSPSIYDEVIVDFENGNIERPFVVGFVHTRSNRPYQGVKNYNKKGGSYLLNKSGGGDTSASDFCITNRSGQSITLSNNADSQKFLNGIMPPALQRVFNIDVTDTAPSGRTYTHKNGDVDKMGGKNAKYFGGNITLTDMYGICTIKSDTTARCITIDSSLGQVKMSAFDGITISAPNGDVKIKGKNISLEAGNNISFVSGKSKSGNGFNEAKGKTTDFLKGAADLGSAAMMYELGWTAKGALDISLLRSVIEVLLRPLEGTLSLKSPGYIWLTSGKGKTVDVLRGETDKDGNSLAVTSSVRDWNMGGLIKKINKHEDEIAKKYGLKSHHSLSGVDGGILSGVVDTVLDVTGLSSIRDFAADMHEKKLNSGARSGIHFSEDEDHHYDMEKLTEDIYAKFAEVDSVAADASDQHNETRHALNEYATSLEGRFKDLSRQLGDLDSKVEKESKLSLHNMDDILSVLPPGDTKDKIRTDVEKELEHERQLLQKREHSILQMFHVQEENQS